MIFQIPDYPDFDLHRKIYKVKAQLEKNKMNWFYFPTWHLMIVLWQEKTFLVKINTGFKKRITPSKRGIWPSARIKGKRQNAGLELAFLTSNENCAFDNSITQGFAHLNFQEI